MEFALKVLNIIHATQMLNSNTYLTYIHTHAVTGGFTGAEKKVLKLNGKSIYKLCFSLRY